MIIYAYPHLDSSSFSSVTIHLSVSVSLGFPRRLDAALHGRVTHSPGAARTSSTGAGSTVRFVRCQGGSSQVSSPIYMG